MTSPGPMLPVLDLRLDEIVPPRRRPCAYCAICGHATQEGKAYCTDHVAEHPYAQEVLKRISDREAEIERVAKRGPRAADPEGEVAREVLGVLWIHGERTVARISRETGVGFEALRSYVHRLKQENRVRQTHAVRRGAGSITLTAPLQGLEDPRDLRWASAS